MAKAKSQEFVYTIYDSNKNNDINNFTKKDVIRFEDINLSNLVYTRQGSNLVISSDGLSVHIVGYFSSKSKIDTIIANDAQGNPQTISISQDANIYYSSVMNNETFNFGKGIGTIHFNTYTGFGDDTVVLNKGERVYLDFSNAELEYEVKGKDVVITSKTGHGGSVTLKNYAAKDTGASVYVNGTDIANQKGFKEMLKFDASDFDKKGKFTGTALNDEINAYAYASSSLKGVTINSGAGNDKITGSKFNDTITASIGDNIIYESSGVNKITTGKGNDKIYLQEGYSSNTIKSTGGDNVVEIRNSGVNKVTLGAGNDEIIIYDGTNTVNAGNSFTQKESIKLNEQGIYPLAQYFYVAGGMNTLTSGKGMDLYQIYDGYNTIKSGADIDTFEIKGGINNIDGGAGDDVFTIYGGYSNNIIQGGAGDDYYRFWQTSSVPTNNTTVINDSKGNDHYQMHYANVKATITDKAGNDEYDVKFFDTSNITISDTKGNDILKIDEDVSNMSLFFNVDAKKGAVGDLNIINKVQSGTPVDFESGVHITNYFTKNGKIETVTAFNEREGFSYGNKPCNLQMDYWTKYVTERVQSWLGAHEYKNTAAVFNSGNADDISSLMNCYTTSYNVAATDVGNFDDSKVNW